MKNYWKFQCNGSLRFYRSADFCLLSCLLFVPTYFLFEVIMNLCENQVKFSLEKSLFVINQYKWLSDSYVLDFFVENHWKNLPQSWQETFTNNFPINELSFLLNYEADSSEKISVVLPLSLLCLRKTIQVLSICRKPQKVGNKDWLYLRLNNLFCMLCFYRWKMMFQE